MRIENWLKALVCLLMVFTIPQTSLRAQIDEEESEEAGEHDGELDDEPDSTFEEYLSTIGYYFDTTLIPASNLYPVWDTKRIHVYDQDISQISDTTMVVLQDGGDCFFHPPCFGYVTSSFGYRQMRRRRRGRMHYGTDVKLYTGDPVYSTFDGVVRIAQYSSSYGYVVVVRHYNGLETIYAHFSKLLTKPGMVVRAGDPIGLGGNTGRSYGSHLHFEIRFKGIAFDATRIIDFETGKLNNDTIYIDKSFFPHLSKTKSSKSKKGKDKKDKKKKKGEGDKSTEKGAKYYTVRSGDTLSSIAVKHGTTITKICQLNGIKKNSILRPGKRLRVR